MMTSRLRKENLAIDIGTSSTVVYVVGKGVVLREPSVVAFKTERGGRRTVLAVGEKARRMTGRTNGTIKVVRPIQKGVIADMDAACSMVGLLVAGVAENMPFPRKLILVGAPLGATPVERQAFAMAARSLGASQAQVLAEPLAVAIGAGLPVAEPSASMVVDIGGGVTEVAIISLGGIVVSTSLRCGGDNFDEAIQRRVRSRYQLAVSLSECERVKIAFGSNDPPEPSGGLAVRGRDLSTGLPREVRVAPEDIRNATAEHVESIVESVHGVIERCPPELAADLMDAGMLLTGGGALLREVGRGLEERVGVPVRIPENPLVCTAHGLGRSLEALSFQ